jgi:PKD repeat protein
VCAATVPATGAILDPIPFAADPVFTGCTQPATYHWNFGDGSSAAGQNAAHAYLAPGTYQWAVTVTTEGFTCIKAGTIAIVNPLCTVECVATVPATSFVGSATHFVAEATLTGCIESATYLWNLGDGSTVTYSNFNTAYQAPGTYNWSLEVSADGIKCVRNGTIVVSVSPCTIVCAATVPATGAILDPIPFAADPVFTGCTQPATYQWNFGDGSSAAGQNAAHAYLSPGTYQWAVTVTTEGFTCIKAGTIAIVNPLCTVECVATVPATSFVGSATHFVAEATLTGCIESATYLWNLGDGSTVTYSNFNTAYQAPGTYNWSLEVSADGIKCVRNGTIVVSVSPCTIVCAATVPATGAILDPIPFAADPVFTGCTQPATYHWNFGDGSSAAGQNAAHAYLSPGTYQWAVTVTTEGFTCIKAGTIVITQPTCTVGCTASVPLTAVALTPFSFAGEATLTNCAGAPAFFWTFGDGGTSSVSSGTHTYATPGSYDWVLEVMADGIMCVRTGTVAVEAGLPGDGDGNGIVSIGEVQQSINMFLGIQAPGNGADCNGDGTVSIGEVQKVINAFLGLASACS